MRTLRDIEADVAARARRIGVSVHDLPAYGVPRDFGCPHVEVDHDLYHYVVTERGEEINRRSSADYDDLLFWVFRDVTHHMAFTYELTSHVEDQDFRRLAFSKWIELMRRLGAKMGARVEAEIADILRRAPYDDARTQALNRMRKAHPD